MKILMLGWELPPHNSGGLGVACLNLARALARNGTEIDFVLPYTAAHDNTSFMQILPATPLEPFAQYGADVYAHNIDGKIIPATDGDHTHLSIRDIQHLYCDYIREYLSTHTPEVVHAHDWLTYEAGIIAKRDYHIPLVAHVHATEYDRAGGHEGNPLIHKIEQDGLRLADRIIAVSEATKSIIADKYHIDSSKIEVAYNSLDESFAKDPYKLDQHLYDYLESEKKSGHTIVTTVGRFTVQKGLTHLMHAAALAIQKNPRLLFIFSGDGEERNHLIELSANFGISEHVIFTGFVRGQKLRDIYALSDVFVMSSISEPFGLTALEAAHHNNALILTHQSGVSEIIWSALKYNFWDERKLAEEIIAISASSTLRHTLVQNLHHEYNQISWDKVAKTCLAVYNRAINHKRN